MTTFLLGAALVVNALVPSAADLVARAKEGPSLVLTRAQTVDLRERIKADKSTADWWKGVRREALGYLKDAVQIPDRGAQWWHYYNCKACGVLLEGHSPTVHRCPKCGKVYSGWPWDDVYVNRYHERLKETVYKCGLVYAVDGDRACAERVKEIMLGYAKRYPKYPLINNSGTWKEGMNLRGFSRAHSQALDEAVWLCRLLPGYDLAKDVFSDGERSLVEKNFFAPAVDIFRTDNFGIQNHECWHLSAYGLIGLLMGDVELVDAAINSKTGLLQQLEKGVDADGCWFEGAWGYHFYAIMALKPIVTALWNLGYAPPARFKMMFDAPFGQMTPNGELPALNNSAPVRFSPKEIGKTYGDLYDLAWLWWKDPRYSWWLGENPVRDGFGHAKYMYGTTDVVGQVGGGRFTAGNFPATGFAVLRSDSKGDAAEIMPNNYVGVDYGPVGGGHGHCDKLNLVLYQDECRIAEDLGCIGYSNQRQWCWYRSSLAHNELVMDGLNQARTAAKCIWHEPRANGGVMLFDACAAYTGAKVRRAIALDGDIVLDLYVAESEVEHRWEWAFHSRGRFETPLALEELNLPPPDPNTKFSWGREDYPADIAWTWTERAKEGPFDGAWSGLWRKADGGPLVSVAQEVVGLDDAKPIHGTFRTAAGTAQPASEFVELSVPRVMAKRVAFLTVYHLGDGTAARITGRSVSSDGALLFSAELDGRSLTLKLNGRGASRPVDFRVAHLTAQEAELRAKLPTVFMKASEHYRALDYAVTPLAFDEKGVVDNNAPNGERIHWRYPHRFDPTTRTYAMYGILQWTAGHYPGALWYLYEATKDDFLRDRALWWTKLLAPNAKVTTNHDIGFVMYCSYGNARRLLKTEEFDPLLVETAVSLCERYSESLGLIRSWGAKNEKRNFKVIPDNMMNLEILEWAAKTKGGDVRFDRIARSHADVTMRHHFRPDGGCYHVLDYDQRPQFCGRVKEILRGQGCSCESAWSRGQAWAIYGYVMMYRETRERRYLDFARKLADYAINNEMMPEDGVPYWDYGAPGEERDTSAAAINSSALLELADYVGGEKGAAYRAFAVKTLLALCSPDYFSEGDEIGHFLLKHGTGAKPMDSEIDVPLNYGDYYFLEALLRF